MVWKKIVLFCAHGTGGLASSVKDIIAALPEDCVIEENVLGVYRPDVTNAQETVLEWLSDLIDTPKAEMKIGTLAYYAPWGNVVMFYDS